MNNSEVCEVLRRLIKEIEVGNIQADRISVEAKERNWGEIELEVIAVCESYGDSIEEIKERIETGREDRR